jgi:hypothetical protein
MKKTHLKTKEQFETLTTHLINDASTARIVADVGISDHSVGNYRHSFQKEKPLGIHVSRRLREWPELAKYYLLHNEENSISEVEFSELEIKRLVILENAGVINQLEQAELDKHRNDLTSDKEELREIVTDLIAIVSRVDALIAGDNNDS